LTATLPRTGLLIDYRDICSRALHRVV
jgi:hypothetical protein